MPLCVTVSAGGAQQLAVILHPQTQVMTSYAFVGAFIAEQHGDGHRIEAQRGCAGNEGLV